ncbi:glyoxalase [Polaribacter sp. Hel1_85]|uniref:glyoxalase n=1 Tax=Polaribacter sp. Hel1_85 TaxID=1250005 RepID=UPI00052BC486|nr:glyoxalase [Polaribacter sp. Hel1_85]KGL63258.1 glyoxalase/bleomycin resistance protein / dioxygenase [Polaribacter sp. Hel1_85]
MEKNPKFKSVRSFIGAKDFQESRSFYKIMGFSEVVLSENMSLFKIDEKLSFYLQKAYVKDWVDNSMLFLEVEDLEEYLVELKSKKLTEKFSKVRLSEIVVNDWGKEFFLHDPSGILWHIGNFKN